MVCNGHDITIDDARDDTINTVHSSKSMVAYFRFDWTRELVLACGTRMLISHVAYDVRDLIAVWLKRPMNSDLVLKAVVDGHLESLTGFIESHGYTHVSECYRREWITYGRFTVSNYVTPSYWLSTDSDITFW